MSYLVNDWLVQPKLNRIVTETQQIQLEPRTMRVLAYLIENKDEVITREQIVKEVWQNVEVSDESLTRSISDIRKIFKENPKSSEVIETIRKVGYRLIANIGTAPTQKKLTILKGLSTVAAVVMLAVLIYLINQSKTSFPKVQSVLPQTSKNGLEFSASYSHDGNRIVYYYLDVDNPSNSGLEILTLADGQSIRLNTPRYTFSPTWSWDDKKIAYSLRKDKQCRLYYYDLNLRNSVEIGSCPGPYPWNILWIPGDKKLLVTAQNTPSSPHQLWEVDIGTGQYNLSPALPKSAIGLFYPTFSKNGRYLGFVAARNNGILIKELTPVIGSIIKFDWTTKTIVAELSIDEEITGFDFDTDDQYVVYSSAEESVQYKLWYSDFAGNRHVLYPDSAKIALPKVSTKRNVIYEQRDINKDIVKINLKQASSELVVNSTRWDMLPDFDKEDRQIAFVSMRSGKAKIWLQNQSNSQIKKLDLREGANTHPQFSPTQEQLAFISTYKNKSDLFVFNLVENNLQQITNDNMQENYPTWSLDGNWIYFSRETNGQQQLWKINLDGMQPSQITYSGGSRAQEIHLNGKESLLFSKKNSNRLWLKELPRGEERELSTITAFNPTSWQFADQKIYYIALGHEKYLLNQYDLITEKVKTIISIENTMNPYSSELTLSSDGEFALVTIGNDRKIDLFQLNLEK